MTNTCSDETCAIDPGSVANSGDSPDYALGPGKHLVYFGDPMCSWCWGFAPELQRIHNALNGRAEFHMVMGGLRPGTQQPWDQEMRSYIRHHWEDVQAKTGQPFNFSRFDDSNFVYDTEPSCRAFVTVRALMPSAALTMYEALQRGFYAQNLTITDAEALADMAQPLGVDRTQFLDFFSGPQAQQLVARDFSRTRAFGVTGFPTVLCAEDDQYGFLSLGYRPYSSLAPLLEEWLNA